MMTLAVISLILGVVGICVAVVTALIRDARPVGPAAGTAVAVIFFVLTAVFGGTSYHNHFYNLHEEYTTSRANVGVTEEKVGILFVELRELVDTYMGHEEKLINAVENRDTNELRALFERYPRLMASTNVQQLANEYTALINEVAQAKLTANAVARAFNTSNLVLPARWFAPDDLAHSLPLYDIQENSD